VKLNSMILARGVLEELEAKEAEDERYKIAMGFRGTLNCRDNAERRYSVITVIAQVQYNAYLGCHRRGLSYR